MSTLREDIYTTLDSQHSDNGDYFAGLREAGYDTDTIDFDAVIDDSLDMDGALTDFITLDTNATRGAATRIAGEIFDADEAERHAALSALGVDAGEHDDLDADDIVSTIESKFDELVAETAALAAQCGDLSQYPI